MATITIKIFTFLFFIFIKYIHAGNSKSCSYSSDCSDNTKCISFSEENYCVLPCEKSKEKEQCGKDILCKEMGDIEGVDKWICETQKECLTDNECSNISPKSTCNLYNLKCTKPEEDKNEDSTISTITSKKITSKKSTSKKSTTITKPSCIDKIPDGPHGCPSFKRYCNDSNYLAILKDLCPKTCGKCNKFDDKATKLPLKCADYEPKCSERYYLCKSNLYKDLMRLICKKTCKYC